MKVSGKQKGKMAFEIDQSGFKYILDAPESAGGEGRGPSPKGLLLSGLIGCTGIDVASVLKKMRFEYDSLDISAETEQTDDYPRVFKDIILKYQFQCKAPDEKKVKKAVALSHEKYCGVSAMLEKNSVIKSEIFINGNKV